MIEIFQIRSILCQFWVMLLQDTASYRMNAIEKAGVSKLDSDRINKMIDFIRKHYMEQISITDIANAASISTRECTRCFQKRLSVTPSSFLTTYRINIASQLLVRSEQAVTSISESCGFSSPSYFAKVFRQVMKISPREYRSQKWEMEY